jgi:hypothetical protein
MSDARHRAGNHNQQPTLFDPNVTEHAVGAAAKHRVRQCMTELDALRKEALQADLELMETDQGIGTLLMLIRRTGIPFSYTADSDIGPSPSPNFRDGSDSSLPNSG